MSASLVSYHQRSTARDEHTLLSRASKHLESAGRDAIEARQRQSSGDTAHELGLREDGVLRRDFDMCWSCLDMSGAFADDLATLRGRRCGGRFGVRTLAARSGHAGVGEVVVIAWCK